MKLTSTDSNTIVRSFETKISDTKMLRPRLNETQMLKQDSLRLSNPPDVETENPQDCLIMEMCQDCAEDVVIQ